jgi:catechol 2,3-dioxygenase-like lactoylglutathione lyase family enzyme
MKEGEKMAGVVGSSEVIQLGYVVRDLEKARNEYAEFLGTPVSKIGHAVDTETAQTQYYGKPAPEAAIDAAMYRLGEGLFMELMKPNGLESAWQEHLDVHGEGIHHIAFYVNGMQKEIDSFEKHGYSLVQKGEMMNETGRYAYFDTRKDLKTTIELLECDIPAEETIRNVVDLDPKYRTSSILGSNDIIQIAIVVRDLETTNKKYAEFLGLPESDIMDAVDTATANTQYYGKPSPNAKLKASGYKIGDGLFLELMQPEGGPSVWWDHLDEYGEGIHHIAFEVKGMDEAIAACEKMGFSLMQRGEMSDGAGRYAYVDSKKDLKITIELLEFDKPYKELFESVLKK